MIAGTYFVSAGLVVLLGGLFAANVLTSASFIALVAVAFFVASAGASSAYLTVSEVFPMETRALAIAFSSRSACWPRSSMTASGDRLRLPTDRVTQRDSVEIESRHGVSFIRLSRLR
jgi:hypothetical protein